MDLFVVPTITFRLVYGFFVIHHGRRITDPDPRQAPPDVILSNDNYWLCCLSQTAPT